MGEVVEAFLGAAAQRFRAYAERLAQSIGHTDRHEPLRGYLTGLVLPGARKSIEPMAALLAPERVRQTHQSLHHLVADAPWEDEALLKAVKEYVLAAIAQRGPIEAWIVDDTGMPKKGRHSVGAARAAAARARAAMTGRCIGFISMSAAGATGCWCAGKSGHRMSAPTTACMRPLAPPWSSW